MNARIRELAEEAEMYVYVSTPEEHWHKGPGWNDLFRERFAQLLVRECQLVINQIDADDPSMTLGLYHAEVAIGNHFGVER